MHVRGTVRTLRCGGGWAVVADVVRGRDGPAAAGTASATCGRAGEEGVVLGSVAWDTAEWIVASVLDLLRPGRRPGPRPSSASASASASMPSSLREIGGGGPGVSELSVPVLGDMVPGSGGASFGVMGGAAMLHGRAMMAGGGRSCVRA